MLFPSHIQVPGSPFMVDVAELIRVTLTTQSPSVNWSAVVSVCPSSS